MLKERGIDFDAVEYHVTGLTEPELRGLIAKSGGSAHDLVRAREATPWCSTPTHWTRTR